MKVFRACNLQDADCDEIVALLRSGGVIAFPTDTAYGLGAHPFDEAAIDRIFKVKGRAEVKPILLLVASIGMAESVIKPNPVFYAVARQFWPGPLTLIVPAKESIPSKLTAGTNTVGVRWPLAPLPINLVQRFGMPLTATSANRSGMPSTITADEVRAQLGESIDALLDGGMLSSRVGSSVLDLTVDPPVLLREGPIPFERLDEFFNGRVRRELA